MPETETIVTLLGLALAAAVQAGTGFGFALLAIPFLTLWHDLPTSIVIVALAGGVSTTQALFRDRDYIQTKLVKQYCIAALVGMPLGLWMLLAMPASALNAMVGVVVLLSTAALHFGVALPRQSSTHYGAGLMSGAMMTSTGINGPPVVLALQSDGVEPRVFRGSMSAVFTFQRVITLLLMWWAGRLTGDALWFALIGIPAILIGWELGNVVFHRLDAERFKLGVEIMLVVSAIASIARAMQ